MREVRFKVNDCGSAYWMEDSGQLRDLTQLGHYMNRHPWGEGPLPEGEYVALFSDEGVMQDSKPLDHQAD